MEARHPHQSTAAASPALDDRAEPVRSENVFCRNYDLSRRYAVDLTVVDGDGTVRYSDRVALRPGQVESVAGVLPAGNYYVTVDFERRRRKTRSICVSPDPDHTVHVEVGNGVVSLTEGLYG